MTNIHFNLHQVSKLEAKALTAMLAVIIGHAGDSHIPGVQTVETHVPHVNARERACPVLPLAEAMEVIELKSEVLPDLLKPEAAPAGVEQEPEKPKRTRRTKAEMEAAAAQEPEKPKRTRRTKAEMEAAAAQENHTQSPAATNAPAAVEPTGPAAAFEAPTLEQLRDALNGYNDRHGLPAATALLGDFECKRLSEIPARPVADQLEFLKLASNV